MLEIAPGVFRNITVESDSLHNKIIFKVYPILQEVANLKPEQEHHISIDSQVEGSRLVGGCFASGLHLEDSSISSHLKNLIYTVEVACGKDITERAIRVTVCDQEK